MASLAKRKDQLKHILSDDGYWKKDSGFKDFLQDQYRLLEKGFTLEQHMARLFIKEEDDRNCIKTRVLSLCRTLHIPFTA